MTTPSIPPQDSCDLSRITGRVYVASPLSTYRTPRYNENMARIETLVPKADLLPARELYHSNAEWREKWPDIRSTLQALVFFDDEEGCIGAGTEQELADAYRFGIPVFFLPAPPFDTIIPCDASGQVEFWPVVDGGMRQTQRVCAAIPATAALAMLKGGG